jgi:hypothetical protein
MAAEAVGEESEREVADVGAELDRHRRGAVG